MTDSRHLSEAFDHCLTLMQQGKGIEFCLSQYPEESEALRPLLQVAEMFMQVPLPTARGEAIARGRERMMAAVEAKYAPKANRSGAPSWLPRSFLGDKAALLRGAALALVIVAVALLFNRAYVPWAPKQSFLADVEGRVLLLPSGSDTWRLASEGDVIENGDRVRVLAEAQAKNRISPYSVLLALVPI